MIREKSKYPYDNYYLYKVYHKNENRNYVTLFTKEDILDNSKFSAFK